MRVDEQTWRASKRRVEVGEAAMAYIDTGAGEPPVVLLHGNPTSSFLWRDVIPPIAALRRCVAPDLVGMGDSDKVAGAAYRFADHARWLAAFLDAVVPEGPLVLVLHDWGSALGFDWARRHAGRVAGIAYMEALVRPVTWDEWPEAARRIFQALRSDAGEELVLEKNVFVERILPASVLAPLDPAVHDAYRRPFAEPGEGRRPVLTWPREIPIDGEPADVDAVVAASSDWLASADVPKLFVNAEPGSILVGAQREHCRSWPHQQEVTVRGSHFIQEDSGPEIGAAIAAWLSA